MISSYAGSQCLISKGINGYTFAPTDTAELAQKMRLVANETPPVSAAQLLSLRPSQMPFTYKEAIAGLVRHLNGL